MVSFTIGKKNKNKPSKAIHSTQISYCVSGSPPSKLEFLRLKNEAVTIVLCSLSGDSPTFSNALQALKGATCAKSCAQDRPVIAQRSDGAAAVELPVYSYLLCWYQLRQESDTELEGFHTAC